jgi:hypothetical protein
MSDQDGERLKVNPLVPLIRRGADGSELQSDGRSQFGPFQDIVEEYAAATAARAKVELTQIDKLGRRLIEGGNPVTHLNGKKLNWHRGLATLCNPEIEGSLGANAHEHFEVNCGLYKRWSDIEGHEICCPMYDDTTRATPPKDRGSYLVPSLCIYDREQLSDHYINAILRPYSQAQFECRQIFWKRLSEGHEEGEWFAFTPTDSGAFVPIPLGEGFGVGRNYKIGRTTYLKGFGYSEKDIGTENYPHSRPYRDQEHWLFIGADEFSDFPLVENDKSSTEEGDQQKSVASPNSRGRRSGTGFEILDEPFVQEGAERVLQGLEPSYSSAATYLLRKHSDKIRNHRVEGVHARLRKRISKRVNELRGL